MDDRLPSPSSSKKSSVISKADLVETPRMSPYRTRSRKNSNLTEENIAVHNDSPTPKSTTRRVTRRMSQDLQGSENAITLTPVPAVTKRSRRSPSVTSDDGAIVTKPKFTLAQENVVLEEDELIDESKAQSQSVIENGSSHLNKAKLETVDGTPTSHFKSDGMGNASVMLTKINFKEQLEMITETDNGEELAKATKVASGISSNLTSSATESVSAINDNSSLSQNVEKPKIDISPSAPEKVSSIGTLLDSTEIEDKSGQLTTLNLVNSVTDTSSAVVSSLSSSVVPPMSTVVESIKEAAVSAISSNDANAKITPKAPSNPVPKMQPATPSKSKVNPAVVETICLDTPLKPVKEIPTTSKTASTDMDVTVVNKETSTKTADTPSKTVLVDMDVTVVNKETSTKTADTPSKTVPVDMDMSVLDTETKIKDTPSKILPVDMDASVLNTETQTKITETPSKTASIDFDMTVKHTETLTKTAETPSKTVSVDMDVSVLNTETQSKPVPVDMDVSVLNTDTQSKTVPVDMDVSVLNTKTQSKTAETPSKTVPIDMDVSVLNIETPTKITETPTKITETPSKALPVDMDVSELNTETPTKNTEISLITLPVDADVSILNTKTSSKITETPSKTLRVDMDVSVLNTETPTKITEISSKTMSVDADVTILSTNTPTKITETPSKTLPVDVSVLNTEISSKTMPVDADVSILNTKTPTKITVTPLNTLPVDMEVSVLNTKTPTAITEVPSKTQVELDISVSNKELPTKTQSETLPVDMDISVLNKETPTKTPLKNVPVVKKTSTNPAKTPAKSVPVEKQDVLDVSNQATRSKTDPMVTSESNHKTPSNTVPLENGTTDPVEQYAKFGGSVHRKSDGKPIDSFGISKNITETTTLTVKQTAKNKSVISINDSSDEDEDEDEDEDGPKNEFIDDEAMDSNGESSMDEEERKYMEENEIPSDGVSLGSDTDVEQTNSDESDDSFVVSDSSVALLDGSGDDLEIDNEKSTLNTSKGKPKRGNKIFDTSEDESVMANLDKKPKKVNLKRRSDTMPRSSEASKRLSLHPNLKLTSNKVSKKPSKADLSCEEMENESVEKQKNKIDDSSEDDEVVASPNPEPEKRKDLKRLTKLNSGELIQEENDSINVKESDEVANTSKDDEDKELSNLDEINYLESYNKIAQRTSMKDDVEATLDSISLDSSIINEIVTSENLAPSSLSKEDQIVIDESSEDELANLDVKPKKTIVSKRLSTSMSSSKKNIRRMSLHPNAKLNCDGFESKKNEKKLTSNEHNYAVQNKNLQNGIEEMDIEQTTSKIVTARSTSAGQHKLGEFSLEDIQAKCNTILNSANEAKREEKLKNKTELQEEKYLKIKEKKQNKLQEKKGKEARRLEREVLAAQQRQLKKEKKLKPKEMTEDEKSKAIQKALAFSEKLKATQHSTETKQVMPNETKEDKNTAAAVKTNKKRKMLTILEDNVVSKKKIKVSHPSQFPAKPEGFIMHSKPIQKPKNLKLRKDKRKVITSIENTSAGIFEVRNVPKKASPFTVTTLDCNPPFKFSNFKDKAILSSNVKRETAAELLARKKRQKTL